MMELNRLKIFGLNQYFAENHLKLSFQEETVSNMPTLNPDLYFIFIFDDTSWMNQEGMMKDTFARMLTGLKLNFSQIQIFNLSEWRTLQIVADEAHPKYMVAYFGDDADFSKDDINSEILCGDSYQFPSFPHVAANSQVKRDIWPRLQEMCNQGPGR